MDGCRLLIPTAWELDSRGPQPRVGRWASAWAWRMARGAVRGGARLDIGAGAMELPRGDGADTAAQRQRTFTAAGATLRMPEHAPRGPILTRAMWAREAGELTTIL